jgi:hypothetical protein
MAHFSRLQQMAFYLGGGCPPHPTWSNYWVSCWNLIGPTWEKTGSMNFCGGYFFCILILEEFPEVGHGSLSLSLSLMETGTGGYW